MAKFGVVMTRIYNGYAVIDAETEEEAMAIASEHIDEYDFTFGETTVDYAEKISDEHLRAFGIQ